MKRTFRFAVSKHGDPALVAKDWLGFGSAFKQRSPYSVRFRRSERLCEDETTLLDLLSHLHPPFSSLASSHVESLSSGGENVVDIEGSSLLLAINPETGARASTNSKLEQPSTSMTVGESAF